MKNLWVNILKPKARNAKWLIFLVLVMISVLGASGYFDVAKQYLNTEALTFQIGEYKISAYGVLVAIVTLILIFWVAAIGADVVEKRIGTMDRLRPATRILLVKIIQIAIYVIALLFSLDIIGVDLTTLTIFSGALGIGLGFGLQKIASNFISGLILLLEKSVEENDLIELPDGTFGFVRKARARYTLVETMDTKEILIPNEDLITDRVTNWTLSSSKGRIEILIGVSYGSDIEKAHHLIVEAAREQPRCIDDPEPKCFLRAFGDSSIDFVLHFWVADVTQGRWQPQSDVLFEIWRKFKQHDIEIPFPQRDLHVKSRDSAMVNPNV